MKNWLKIHKVLLISSIGTLTLLIFGIISSTNVCYHNKICFRFFDSYITQTIAILLLLPPPLLFLSLLTYRMRDEIFRAWTAFARWWIPLSMIAILVTPRESGGFISIPLQATLALFCAGVFLIVSLIIIAWKHYSLKKNK